MFFTYWLFLFVMKRNYVLLTLFALLLFPLLHEIGHYVMAYFLGGTILKFNYFYVCLMPGSIYSIQKLILFKLGGLIFTFYPSLIVFLYYYHINSNFNYLSLLFLFLSPLSSITDFIQITDLISVPYLSNILSAIFLVMIALSTISLITNILQVSNHIVTYQRALSRSQTSL